MKTSLIDKLKAEGWAQQFSASGVRLEEAVENYRRLGFEIKTVPMKDLECDGCTICFDDEGDDSVMIFTRKAADQPGDELF
jgi:nucleoside-triphosphatase THEP1